MKWFDELIFFPVLTYFLLKLELGLFFNSLYVTAPQKLHLVDESQENTLKMNKFQSLPTKCLEKEINMSISAIKHRRNIICNSLLLLTEARGVYHLGLGLFSV